MNNLNERQLLAVNHDGNVIIEANPGSGKTSTIIGRFEKSYNSNTNIYRTLALITYTNAGVDEIYSRINVNLDDKVFIGTIHLFCLQYILRPYYWIHKIPVKIISDELIKEFYDSISYKKNSISPLSMKDDLSLIRINKNGELNYPTYLSSVTSGNIATFCSDYIDFKKNKNIIDFNDILYLSYKLIIENPFISRSMARYFHEILIDEFQDTSELQYEIIKLIYNYKLTKVFFVGDPKQTIMRFAGAKIDSYNTINQDFVIKKITLVNHYRSSKMIMDNYMKNFNNHPTMINISEHINYNSKFKFIKCNIIQQSCSKDCYTCKNDVNVVEKIIEYYKSQNIVDEEIAILSNWHLHSWKISTGLKNKYTFRGTGALPHKKVNDPFYELIVKYIRYTNSNYSINAFNQFKKQVKQCIILNGLEIEKSIVRLANDLLIQLNKIPLDTCIEDGFAKIKEIINSVLAIDVSLFDSILEILKAKGFVWSMKEYFSALDYDKGIYNDTIHSAKGKEFDAVILFKMDDNYLPHFHSNNSEDEYDSIRKLYVGMSRARKHVIVVYSEHDPSRFIKKWL